MELPHPPGELSKRLPLRDQRFVLLHAPHRRDRLEVAVDALGVLRDPRLEGRRLPIEATDPQVRQRPHLGLQIHPQPMERPARAVSVPVRDPKRGVLLTEVAQEIPLELLEICERSDAEGPQNAFAHLLLDTPCVLVLPPEEEEPDLIALLLDLGHLVVDTEDDVIPPEGERLDSAVLPVLAILVRPGDEVILGFTAAKPTLPAQRRNFSWSRWADSRQKAWLRKVTKEEGRLNSPHSTRKSVLVSRNG